MHYKIAKEKNKWQLTLATGVDFILEIRIRRNDGTFRWHLSQSIAQKDNERNITGWIGTNTDINEQKMLEQKKMISLALQAMK